MQAYSLMIFINFASQFGKDEEDESYVRLQSHTAQEKGRSIQGGILSAAQSSTWSGTSNQHQFIMLDCETEQEHFVSRFILPGQPQQMQPAAPGLKVGQGMHINSS